MARKKEAGGEWKKIGLEVPADLWDRFKAHGQSLRPRANVSALLEVALIEYLEKHEQPKKGRDER